MNLIELFEALIHEGILVHYIVNKGLCFASAKTCKNVRLSSLPIDMRVSILYYEASLVDACAQRNLIFIEVDEGFKKLSREEIELVSARL